MPVRVAHHRKVTHHTTSIYRRLHQDVLLTGLFDDSINFLLRVTLKPKVIEPRLHFILNDHQHKDWIFAGRSRRAEPDIVAAFEPPVADD